MRITPETLKRCTEDIERLLSRHLDASHLFHDELVSHLFAAHVLDLYDIHAKSRAQSAVSSRAVVLLRRFTEELSRRSFRQRRDLSRYAEKLCVTPEYLSEICCKVSGRGADYFIGLFTVGEIAWVLLQKNISVRRIAEDFNFS